MNNPCGKYVGAQNPIVHRSTGGKLTQVFGRRSTVKRLLKGGK